MGWSYKKYHICIIWLLELNQPILDDGIKKSEEYSLYAELSYSPKHNQATW